MRRTQLSHRSPLAAALLAAVLLCLPASARAAWFTGEPLDGPSPLISELGDVDLARDGTGGLVYVKEDGGVPHVFLSRHVGGSWRPPERVDGGVETAATQPRIAAGDDHRLAIVWVSGGRLFGVVAPGGPPTPLPAPQMLYADADPLKAVTDPSIDMGINGTAYAVFTAPGTGATDVRAVRLQDTTWEGVPAPLDIAGDQPAGAQAGRARVAVSAEGNAVAVWGEHHADGRERVYGRRVTGLATSLAPQEVSLPSYDGAAGGDADSPDIDIEDDGSYAWVVFRQDFGGRSRALARRLVGSLFEAPSPVDGGGTAETPRMNMNGRGVGAAVAAIRGSNAIFAPILERDVFTPAFQLDSGGNPAPAMPVVAASEREDVMVAWRGPGESARARYRDGRAAFEPEATISAPDFGPVPAEGFEAAEDRAGNFAVAFLQGGPAGRRVVVAVYDRPPGLPVGLSTTNYQRRTRPTFRWRPGSDLWGAQTFKVVVDGQEIGRSDRNTFTATTPLDEGAHRWQAVAIDRRGQETAGRLRTMRIDVTEPEVELKVEGKRKRGELIKVSFTASDSFGSGLKYALLDFGDGSPQTSLRRVVHRYRRPGRFSLTVKAVDRAGNVMRRIVRMRIRK